MLVVKHDARTGTIGFFLSTNEGERAQLYSCNSIEFVSEIIIKIARGSSNDDKADTVVSNPTLGYVYNCFEYEQGKVVENFGLVSGDCLYDSVKFNPRVYYREIGIVRSIDGKAPSENADIKKVFVKNPVPMFINLQYSKYSELINASHLNGFKRPDNGKDVILVSDNSAIDSRNTRGTSYLIQFTVKDFTDAVAKKITNYAKGFLMELKEYINSIKGQDAFLSMLYMDRFRQPNITNELNNLGINDVDTLNHAFEENGSWKTLYKKIQLVKNGISYTEADDKPTGDDDIIDDNPTKDELMASLTEGMNQKNKKDETVEVADSSLPF